MSAVFVRRSLQILWPAFVMAGMTEMMVFAVVDPGELHWFGGDVVEWSRQAVYTVSFLIFWLLFTVAGAITVLLVVEEPAV